MVILSEFKSAKTLINLKSNDDKSFQWCHVETNGY